MRQTRAQYHLFFHRERIGEHLAARIPLEAYDVRVRLPRTTTGRWFVFAGRRGHRVPNALRAARPQVHRRFDGRRQVSRRAPVQYFGSCVNAENNLIYYLVSVHAHNSGRLLVIKPNRPYSNRGVHLCKNKRFSNLRTVIFCGLISHSSR